MFKTYALIPRVSEKSYGLSQLTRTYVFDIPKDMNKQSVAHAVTAQFDVTVTNVNVMNVVGKAKRTMTKRRQAKGRDAASRKAYVTVAEGQSIPIFAAEEQAEAKQEKLQAELDKAADKKAAKEAKPAKRLTLKRAKKEEDK